MRAPSCEVWRRSVKLGKGLWNLMMHNIRQHLTFARVQRAPNPPEFAQPRLSRSNGGHPQPEGTNLGVFVPIWLVLPRCEATNCVCVCLIWVISPHSNATVQIGVEIWEGDERRKFQF